MYMEIHTEGFQSVKLYALEKLLVFKPFLEWMLVLRKHSSCPNNMFKVSVTSDEKLRLAISRD